MFTHSLTHLQLHYNIINIPPCLILPHFRHLFGYSLSVKCYRNKVYWSTEILISWGLESGLTFVLAASRLDPGFQAYSLSSEFLRLFSCLWSFQINYLYFLSLTGYMQLAVIDFFIHMNYVNFPEKNITIILVRIQQQKIHPSSKKCKRNPQFQAHHAINICNSGPKQH